MSQKHRTKIHGSNLFRTGRRGSCEALLFEVTGRDEAGERKERVAATDIPEVMRYLRWRHQDFRVSIVQELGLIVLLSGSPLD